MRAFWWFKENSIAGMARPGFNHAHWYDLPFDEAMAVGWLGLHSTGSLDLKSFREHLRTYGPKVFQFYNLDMNTGPEVLKVFDDPAKLMEVFQRLGQRSRFMKSLSVYGDTLEFEMCEDRLAEEVEFLKSKGIDRVISLTEKHHNRDFLEEHFKLHHIGIEDMGAPRLEQVHVLKEVLEETQKNKERIAVHCLAGIGRTSTMLMASHMIMGHDFEDLLALINRQNPTFVLAGPQAEFLHSIKASLPLR